MARFIAQIIIAGTQVVARAFARAVKQEMQASQEAASRLGSNTRGRAEQLNNLKLGLSLDEAKQILNIKDVNKEEINERYEYLFKANGRERGGSFYLQSKIVRAKERLEHELIEPESKAKTAESASRT